MQWHASPNGGFTDGDPWLALVDPEERNVAAQRTDDDSLLALYRRLIAARRASPALLRGEHRSILGLADGVIAYLREVNGQRVVVTLNTSAESRRIDLSRFGTRADVLVGTLRAREGQSVALAGVDLAPLEGVALIAAE